MKNVVVKATFIASCIYGRVSEVYRVIFVAQEQNPSGGERGESHMKRSKMLIPKEDRSGRGLSHIWPLKDNHLKWSGFDYQPLFWKRVNACIPDLRDWRKSNLNLEYKSIFITLTIFLEHPKNSGFSSWTGRKASSTFSYGSPSRL